MEKKIMLIKEEKIIEKGDDYTLEQISGSFNGKEFIMHRLNDSKESRLEVFSNYSEESDENLIEKYYDSEYDCI
jgi:hypothetical protein